MARRNLPVQQPASFPDRQPRLGATVHGILLAAGTSSRYGKANKLLATVDGQPLVRHAAEALLASAVDGITVVVGHEADYVTAALEALPVTVRLNKAYAEGQSISVQTGIERAAAQDADAALVALGDMPNVDPTSVDLLVDAYERGVADVVAAAYEGKRGNPVLFDVRFFDELTDVDGDVGGRRLLTESDAAVAIETADPAVLCDVDRPSDLDKAR
ncbi:nucleotidyltransferase family protein [Natrinema gelatinilyticum]|uniref:nucleotidyltransferase family protein n=1 Tax=Natrinema gelatinilyticum TaxID=2961571 RepID=UPI0020C1CED8|nr:nucleotidyltransferase family protein [Natrinema gelatinilyticum]